jgi:phosphoribosylaminoimidazolecarboxamide formyltransferase/IMP cyclohydrolase
MRYGMNPHQAAEVVGDAGAVSVVRGEPSLINYLDALNGWQLVAEASRATNLPAASSFKHVSPAGVATAGAVDATAGESSDVPVWVDAITSAYLRARDADPKSSFGDVVAVSHPVTDDLAGFLTGTITDAIIAPGYEAGTVAKLSRKRGGRFLIFEVTRRCPYLPANAATCAA